MVGFPTAFAARQTLPNVPPVPLLAIWSNSLQIMAVTFDQVIRPATFVPANWDAHTTAYSITFTTAALSDPRTLTLDGTPHGGAMPSALCYYTPPPHDLRNMRGLPVAQFLNFPLTVVP